MYSVYSFEIVRSEFRYILKGRFESYEDACQYASMKSTYRVWNYNSDGTTRKER